MGVLSFAVSASAILPVQHNYLEEGRVELAPSLTSALPTPMYLKDLSYVSYAVLLPALD